MFRRRRTPSTLVERINEYVTPHMVVGLVPLVRDGVTVGWRRAA